LFQPLGGVAGVPARAFQVPSVTIRVESSWAAAMIPLALAWTSRPSTAITLVPATRSDLMSATWEVCQPLLAVPGELVTCVPLTKATSPSSPLTRRTALATVAGSVTVKVLRR
jgi:hypothetical protein